MKRTILMIGAGLALVGFMAFGMIGREGKNKECKPTPAAIAENSKAAANAASEFMGTALFVKAPVLAYMVSGTHGKPITQKQLARVNSVEDLMSHYPSNWIKGYNSMEVITQINGEEKRAISPNNVFNQAQKALLMAADLSTDVKIQVNYQAEAGNGKLEEREMKVAYTVVPATEAQYAGGYELMVAYLREQGKDKFHANAITNENAPLIRFTVNENGATEAVHVIESSENPEIDQILLDMIKEMPKWVPAKNVEGVPVKQSFDFKVGPDLC